MAFERFSINRGGNGVEPGPGFANPNAPPAYNPGNRPQYNGPAERGNWSPGSGNGVEPGPGFANPNAPPAYNPGNRPQTGGPLPPYQGGGSVSYGTGNSAVVIPSGPGGNWPFGGNPAAGGERPGTYGVGGPRGTGGGARNGPTNQQRFQQAFEGWLKNGAKGVFAGFPGDAVLSRGFSNQGTGGGGRGGNGKDPRGNGRPPVTNNPQPPSGQWGNPTAPFPQNPYDVPNPLQPANNPWLASLPQRDWMTMPSASPGYDQAPPPVPWRPPY